MLPAALAQLFHQLTILVDLVMMLVFGAVGGAAGAGLVIVWLMRGPLDHLQESCCREQREELARTVLRLQELAEREERRKQETGHGLDSPGTQEPAG